MVVLIEGMDFSGKSTITPQVIELLRKDGYLVSHNEGGSLSCGSFRRFVLWVYEKGKLPRWMAQIVHHSVPFFDLIFFRKPKTRQNAIHVQQGYADRVIAYDHAVGNWLGKWILEKCYPVIDQFDVKILISANLETRIERYQKSGRPNQKDEARFFTEDGLARFKKIDGKLMTRAQEHGYIIFDNTHQEVNESVMELYNIIKDRMRTARGQE